MSYVAGKTKNELLNDLASTAQPGSAVHEQQKLGIVVRATEDIETSLQTLAEAVGSLRRSMEMNSRSEDILARRVYWLNVVITTATVVGTIIAACATFAKLD